MRWLMETENTSTIPLRITYVLVCLLLILPVIMMPLTTWLSGNPTLSEYVYASWLSSVAILLMVSVSFDTFLYGVRNRNEAINAALWIAIYAMFTVSALSETGNALLLALMLFIHTIRSGLRLFRKPNPDWWLWPAWCRDILSTLAILFWLSNF